MTGRERHLDGVLDRLRTALDGPVWSAAAAGLAGQARPWNLAVHQPVVAVAEPTGVTDVVTLVRAARDEGLTLAPQARGHGATGNTDGAVLVRTHRMSTVTVRAEERKAVVGAGAGWGALQSAAAPYGLTGLPGSSPVVSVAGYVLGGGLSWFGRRHGWAADSVTAFEVVDAEGVARRVSATNDPDLFWAMRGGGGDLALVTAVELDLHPAPELYGGRMLWPVAAAPQLLDVFRDVTSRAPEELTVWFVLLHFPGGEPMAAVDVTHLGREDDARDLLAPFDAVGGRLSDSRRPLGTDEIGSITAEPTEPSPGASRAVLVTELDEVAARTLLSEPIAPLLTVQLRHLGGALAGPSDSPHGPLTEPFALYLFGVASDAEAGAAVRRRQAELVTALAGRLSGRKPFTFLTAGESVAAAFPDAAVRRLRDLKERRDPRGVFRANFPVAGG